MDSYGIFGVPLAGGSVVALGGALGVPGPDGTRAFFFPPSTYTPGASYAFHAFAFTAAGKGADSSQYRFTAPACQGDATLAGSMQAYPTTATDTSQMFATMAASGWRAAPPPPAPARLSNIRVPTPSPEDQAELDAMVDSIVQLLLAADGDGVLEGEHLIALQ